MHTNLESRRFGWHDNASSTDSAAVLESMPCVWMMDDMAAVQNTSSRLYDNTTEVVQLRIYVTTLQVRRYHSSLDYICLRYISKPYCCREQTPDVLAPALDRYAAVVYQYILILSRQFS